MNEQSDGAYVPTHGKEGFELSTFPTRKRTHKMLTCDMRTHHRGKPCATTAMKLKLCAQQRAHTVIRCQKTSEHPLRHLSRTSFPVPASKSSTMVNPLVLLPLLTAPKLNTTTNGCYSQTPPGHTQLEPTTFVVCAQAINSIAAGRELAAPLAFGRSVKVGHKLPDQFSHKGFYSTCIVKIDMKEGEQDTLTWRDVLVGASFLRDFCVGPPPHFGGEAKAGPRQILDIEVYGVSNE